MNQADFWSVKVLTRMQDELHAQPDEVGGANHFTIVNVSSDAASSAPSPTETATPQIRTPECNADGCTGGRADLARIVKILPQGAAGARYARASMIPEWE